jgi:hypothetical protein
MRPDVDLDPVEAYVLMESEGPWAKPEIKSVVDRTNSFYVTFRTVLQTFNTWNRNGRNYLSEAMIPALNAPHLVELRAKKSWVGENGHPKSTVPVEVLAIDPKNICHKIDNIDVKGNTLYGQITTLDDDMWGRQMTKHILQGMEVAFSLRALASITKIDGRRGMVKSQPHIVTYDRVILPSHREAYQDTSTPIAFKSAPCRNTVQEAWEYKVNEDDAQRIIRESAGRFVADESERFKDIVKIFDVMYESVGFSADGKSVFIKDTNSNRTFNIKLESYVDQQISDIFRNIV